MVDEGIGVNDVPFMQVFEHGSQHSEITGRCIELESLFFGEVVLQVFDEDCVHFLYGNILHMVAVPDEVCQMLAEEQQAFQPPLAAVYAHALTEAVDILVRMIKQSL